MDSDCILQLMRRSDYNEVVSLGLLSKLTRSANQHFWHEWVSNRTGVSLRFDKVANWRRLAQYVQAGALDMERSKAYIRHRTAYHQDELDLFVLADGLKVPRDYVHFDSMAASSKDTIVRNSHWLGISTTMMCDLANLVYSSGFTVMRKDFMRKAVLNGDFKAIKFCVDRMCIQPSHVYETALMSDSCAQTMVFIAGMLSANEKR